MQHPWQSMSPNDDSDFKGCWAILWRSFLYLPYMLGVFIVVVGVWLLRWILPFSAAVFLYDQDWYVAGATLGIWLFALWSYRRFRLGRFFESPPSLL